MYMHVCMGMVFVLLLFSLVCFYTDVLRVLLVLNKIHYYEELAKQLLPVTSFTYSGQAGLTFTCAIVNN